MGLFGDMVKGVFDQANKISKEKARSMTDDELLRFLDHIDEVPSPIAQEAILNEARRRGMR